MATWGTQIQKAGNGLSNAWSALTRDASDLFGSVKRSIEEVKSAFKNGGTTVVGINVNKIPEMKTAISEYCKGIDDALADLKNYDPEVAFKGEQIVPQLKNYIDAVIEACSAITSNMMAFSDQLTEVQNAYAKKDEATASTIGKSAESTRSQYGRYSGPGAQGV